MQHLLPPPASSGKRQTLFLSGAFLCLALLAITATATAQQGKGLPLLQYDFGKEKPILHFTDTLSFLPAAPIYYEYDHQKIPIFDGRVSWLLYTHQHTTQTRDLLYRNEPVRVLPVKQTPVKLAPWGLPQKLQFVIEKDQ